MRLGPLVKGVSLILTLVVLFFVGTIGWEYLQPKHKTTVHFLGPSKKDFNAAVHASGLYAEEATEHFGNGNEHLDCLPAGEEGAAQHLGPGNTLLFYRYGDLTVDEEQDASRKTVKISRNGTKESRYQSDSWMDLRKLFEQVCDTQVSRSSKVNRILFLDVGEVDENILWEGVSIVEQIESLLKEMRDGDEKVQNVDRFWVLVSAGDHQKSWFAPELGSSVFSYFVSRGLEGAADHEGDKVSLGNLRDYVETSVDNWVRDFRDSSQTPRLITVAKTKLQDVKLVFHNGGSDSSSEAGRTGLSQN